MKKVQGFTWTVEDTNLITYHEIYGDVLVELGQQDERIVCLTADLANTTKIGRFKEAFPERFFNVGIAEQNMVAMASGLAATGLKPVISTYAIFATLRAAEFIRTDIAYNQRDVTIIGTLSGVSFGQGGATHHAQEDLALMRSIPNMLVLAPCDGYEAAKAVRAAVASSSPAYIRIARSVEHYVHKDQDFAWTLGKASLLKEGSDITVIACGITVYHALSAAERAQADGVSVRVLNMHTLKPLDHEAVLQALTETRRIVTVEDHSIVGGLGSAVAEVIASSGKGCAFRKLAHPDRFSGMGYPDDLIHDIGIDDEGILKTISELMKVDITVDDDWQDES